MSRWQLALATGLLLLALVSSAKVKRRRATREWHHNNKKVCSGTYNGRTLAGMHRIEDLRNMYENCTRVRGNLEITHLTADHMKGNETLHDILKIFNYIEEIKGYLLIYNVDMDILKFPNLKIIWGDEHFEDHTGTKGATLMISGNHNLKEIHMPKLRSIHSGDVLIENNSFLCYLKDKVNWDELLNMEADTRLIKRHDAFRQCEELGDKTAFHCNSTCASGHCWGPTPSTCQEVYRTPCQHCSSGQCFLSEEGSYECCHMACEGGCSGPRDSDCVACKELKLDNSCVTKCPPLKILDKKLAKMVNNPAGYYTDDRYCVKQCPKQMLVEDENCVRHCSEGYFHDMTKDSRECERCPNGQCTAKSCEVNAPLTGSLLRNLTGCEIINGFLRIQSPLMKSTTDGFNVSDLEVLRSVRMVSEYVSIVAGVISPTNLSFLENLEMIEGRDLDTKKYALVISKNDNLRELGLRKLKKIKAGNVYIRDNHVLCYVSTINWTQSIISSDALAAISNNVQEKNCERKNKVCHRECDPEEGCWGQGPKMCVECANWKLNDTCVKKCPENGYYLNEETRECLPCYEQCLQCKGPSEADCLTCISKSLWEKEQLSCLEECPITHFLEDNQCLPCHDSCYEFGCTGSQKTLGVGGCNKCMFGLEAKFGVIECLYNEGSQSHVCEANNLTNYYVSTTPMEGVELVHCAECDKQCLTCTSAGRELIANGCQCKNYEKMEKGKKSCSDGCSGFFFKDKEKTANETGVCISCAEECDHNSGCWGPDPSNCNQCANASVVINDTKVCVKGCPLDKPFLATVEGEKVCADKDLDAIRNRRKTLVYIGAACLIFIFVIIFLLVLWRYRRIDRKLEKEKLQNMADIPEMLEMTTAHRPNLNKVKVISSHDLENNHNAKLGSGAFGVVYRGYWIPKPGMKKVPVAIKVVRASGKIRGEEEGRMLEEAGRMAQLKHQHLVRLMGICLRDDGLELVTLLRPLGDLLKFLRKHQEKLLGKHLLLYCYQIASGMKYLYEQKLVHRDLAARNVLVKNIDHIEITDFGLSKFIAYGEQEVKVSEGKVAFKWLAPECSANFFYTHQSDIWSYGVTCWEILTLGQSPYQGMDIHSIRSFISDGNRLEQPRNCSVALYQILLHCWMLNPDSRPSFPFLYDRFKEICMTPLLYITQDAAPSEATLIEIDPTKELRELLADEFDCWENVEDPLNYLDGESMDTDSLMGQPMGRNLRRLTSTASSHRYQTDPMSRPNLLASKSVSFGMEDNCYLVPNSKINEQQVLYTPIVNGNGVTELVETNEYYNDSRPSTSGTNEYYNDVNKETTAAALNKIQEESEEVEKESCL